MNDPALGLEGQATVNLILIIDEQGQQCVHISGEGKLYRYGREIVTDEEFAEAMREVIRRVFPAEPPKHLIPLTEFTLNEPCAHIHVVEQQTGDGTPVEFCSDCGANRIIGHGPCEEG